MDNQARSIVSRIPPDHPLKGRFEVMVAQELRATGLGWSCKIHASEALTHWLLEFELEEGQRKERFVMMVKPDAYDDAETRTSIRAGVRTALPN